MAKDLFEVEAEFEWSVYSHEDLKDLIVPRSCNGGNVCCYTQMRSRKNYGSIPPWTLFDCLCCIGIGGNRLTKALCLLMADALDKTRDEYKIDPLINDEVILDDVFKYCGRAIAKERLQEHIRSLESLSDAPYPENEHPCLYDYEEMAERDLNYFVIDGLCGLLRFAISIYGTNLYEDDSPIDYAMDVIHGATWLVTVREKGLDGASEEEYHKASWVDARMKDILNVETPWIVALYRLFEVQREVVLENMPDLPERPTMPSHQDMFDKCFRSLCK